jgi:hypothetical protein
MAALRAEGKRLKQLLDEKSAVSSLALEDGTVGFKLALPQGSSIRVSVVYTDPDDYPNSGVCLLCDDDDGASAKLAEVQERFESKAPLQGLLAKVRPGPSPRTPRATRVGWQSGAAPSPCVQIGKAFKVPVLSEGSPDAAGDTTADPDNGAEDMDADCSSDYGSDYDMDDDDAADLSDGDDRELMQQVATKKTKCAPAAWLAALTSLHALPPSHLAVPLPQLGCEHPGAPPPTAPAGGSCTRSCWPRPRRRPPPACPARRPRRRSCRSSTPTRPSS